MAQRITQSDLQSVVDRFNSVTNSPMQPWEDGKAQIGNYHLSGAYGGVGLHRMFNKNGGIQDIFGGHMSRRELHGKMHAWLDGYERRMREE